MSRSTTTGLYTRVSNSFSQPVTGTTIDPTDADTFFDDVEESMNSFICTSTTSLAIGAGTKAFTTQTTKAFLVGMFVQAFSQANHANYMYGTVVSYTGGVLTLDVTDIGGSGTFTDWLLFTSGVRGGTGATGLTGREAGINYKWNASTSTGDPTTGKITISNSGTVLNISETDDDGNALASVIATWDDSTTTGNRGKLYLMKTGGVGLKVFTITSAVTDSGTYDSFTGTVITVGSFSDGDECFCYFIPTGDKGADGAGTGDVVGPAASVDSEIALFNSTTGKLIKRASISGLAKLSSGVLSAAAAGTDYLAPAAIGVTVQAYDATIVNAAAIANTKLDAIEFVIDGGGATITTGVKGYLEIPYACTITRSTLLADQSGSIVVDIFKDSYANYPPVVGDKITASAPPTISAATKAQDSTLTGWTTSIAAGDILAFNVNSITTCQRVTISLRVTKT